MHKLFYMYDQFQAVAVQIPYIYATPIMTFLSQNNAVNVKVEYFAAFFQCQNTYQVMLVYLLRRSTQSLCSIIYK